LSMAAGCDRTGKEKSESPIYRIGCSMQRGGGICSNIDNVNQASPVMRLWTMQRSFTHPNTDQRVTLE
jgi:hypothetical protein